MRNFAIRKVRDGKVKICRKWFAPREPAPQLEGKWMAFGLYHEQPFVCLWGTKETYVACRGNDEEYERCWEAQMPLLTKDGVLLWEWWDAIV